MPERDHVPRSSAIVTRPVALQVRTELHDRIPQRHNRKQRWQHGLPLVLEVLEKALQALRLVGLPAQRARW